MKKTILIAMNIIVVIVLSSCNKPNISVEELQRENALMAEIIQENEAKITELESTIQGLTGDTATAISFIDTESGLMTFNTLGDKIVFPKKLEYTGSKEAPNTSSINLSQGVSIRPSNNWIVKIGSTECDLYHPSEIIGRIKVGAIRDTLKTEEIKDTIIAPFLKSIPATDIKYGKIFLDDRDRGQYANSKITINESPATLKIGVIGSGEKSIIYIFIYLEEKNITKEELIDGLLNTMKVGSQVFSLN